VYGDTESPLSLYVAGDGRSVQDVTVDIDMFCPGATPAGAQFTIASIALASGPSFAGRASAQGLWDGSPATFSYTFSGDFHGVAANGATRVAGLIREDIVYRRSGTSETCTSNLLPWSATSSHISALAPAPVLARTVSASVVSGQVLVEQPGGTTFVPLTASTLVPVGSTLDTTNGKVKLTAAGTAKHITHSGEFFAGEFKLTQARSGLTDLTLTGGTACAASAATPARPPRHVRKLWGSSHGSFQTSGQYASASDLGTRWLTADTCAGTQIRVAAGAVRVTNLVTHATFVLRAPRSYLAHS